ncbi:MAG TPA: Ig-like domain-containing protein [Kofleriaceae bacterium]|nr:Ig-like domain-containing protein [Kofleriaceae bacterium]
MVKFWVRVFLLSLICLSWNCSGNDDTEPTSTKLLSVQLSTENLQLAAGETVQLHAIGQYDNGELRELTSTCAWTSSAPTHVVVSAGTVVGQTPGMASITANCQSLLRSAAVTVLDARLLSLTIAAVPTNLPLGISAQLQAIGGYSNGQVVDVTQYVTWSTQGTSCTVNSNGQVTAHIVGNCQVNASKDPIVAEGTFAVVDAALQQIDIAPTGLAFAKGLSAQLRAIGAFSDGSHRDITSSAHWVTDDAAIAEVSNGALDRGLVYAKGVGQTTIRVSQNQIAAAAFVVVGAAEVVGINISETSVAIPAGTNKQLALIATFTDGTMVDVTDSANWRSSDPAIATISSSLTRGNITAIREGVTSVEVLFDGFQVVCDVTVLPATVTAIQLSPTSLTLARGEEQRVIASALYSDGTSLDVSDQASWTVSSTALTLVAGSPSQRVRGVLVGAFSISASFAGKTAAIPVTVVQPKLRLLFEGNGVGEVTVTHESGARQVCTTSCDVERLPGETASIVTTSAVDIIVGLSGDCVSAGTCNLPRDVGSVVTVTFNRHIDEEWRVLLPAPVLSTVVLNNGDLLVGTEDGTYRLNSAGAILWHNSTTPGWATAGSNGSIIVLVSGDITRLDAAGQVVWQRDTNLVRCGMVRNGRPMAINDLDQIAVQANNSIALFAANGDLLWTKPLPRFCHGSVAFGADGRIATNVEYSGAESTDILIYTLSGNLVETHESVCPGYVGGIVTNELNGFTCVASGHSSLSFARYDNAWQRQTLLTEDLFAFSTFANNSIARIGNTTVYVRERTANIVAGFTSVAFPTRIDMPSRLSFSCSAGFCGVDVRDSALPTTDRLIVGGSFRAVTTTGGWVAKLKI